MLYANVGQGKLRAYPNWRGNCPGCGGEVIAKCGEINSWHWSHASRIDCDPWREGESKWHLDWKSKMPLDCCEVVMGAHRADIVTPSGHIIELQHSSLSPEDVRRREAFYGPKMLWIVDASEFVDNLIIRQPEDKRHVTFRWKYPRKWMFTINRPLFWDLGDGIIISVQKIHSDLPTGGWGIPCSIDSFQAYYGLAITASQA
jgi:competence CoiA-like predicted nuclease